MFVKYSTWKQYSARDLKNGIKKKEIEIQNTVSGGISVLQLLSNRACFIQQINTRQEVLKSLRTIDSGLMIEQSDEKNVN